MGLQATNSLCHSRVWREVMHLLPHPLFHMQDGKRVEGPRPCVPVPAHLQLLLEVGQAGGCVL